MENRAIIEFVIGACFVIFYAYYRFTKTRTDDHLPLTPRYLTAMLIYMLISVSIYTLMSLAITTCRRVNSGGCCFGLPRIGVC